MLKRYKTNMCLSKKFPFIKKYNKPASRTFVIDKTFPFIHIYSGLTVYDLQEIYQKSKSYSVFTSEVTTSSKFSPPVKMVGGIGGTAAYFNKTEQEKAEELLAYKETLSRLATIEEHTKKITIATERFYNN